METEGSISGGAPRTWRTAGHPSANVNIWEFKLTFHFKYENSSSNVKIWEFLTDYEDGLIFLCQLWDLETLFKFNLHGHYNFFDQFWQHYSFKIPTKPQPQISQMW